MTKQLQRERRVSLGPIDVTVAMPDQLADRLHRNPLYRRAVRPAIDRLGGRRSPSIEDDHTVIDLRRDTSVPIAPSELSPEGREIIQRASGRDWYHTLELGHGVITPGFVDHRPQLPYYGIPASLEGKRVLDIATYDGFWAFEFERRGAAEVVAADVPEWSHADVPRLMLKHIEEFSLDAKTGTGFEIAHEILDSKVKRIERSVYDLDPDEIGTFDFVFISDLLVHLRDPQLAIERAFSVCHGEVLIADVVTPTLEGFGDKALAQFTAPGETWWLPNVQTLKNMMLVAGFEPIDEISRFALNATANDTIHKVVLRGAAPKQPTWIRQALEWKSSATSEDGATWPQQLPEDGPNGSSPDTSSNGSGPHE